MDKFMVKDLRVRVPTKKMLAFLEFTSASPGLER